jgi:tetratricopeptide (TPR) repeat protein
LQVIYLDDLRIAQFLESARLRISVSSGLQRGAQLQARSGWLRRLWWLGAALVLLGLVVAVFLAYQAWTVPAQAERARLDRLEQTRQVAEVQIASGLYADAIRTYQEILAAVPNDPAAMAGLARAQRSEQAAKLYAQATEAMNAGDQAKAMQLLEEINKLELNYRDSSGLMDQIKSTQALAESFDGAVKVYQADNWLRAAQAFEAVRSTNPNFRPDEVKEYLFNSYAQLGTLQVEEAETIAAIQMADGYFQRALQVRPLDQNADAARQTVTTFLDGAEAYQAKNWDMAIRKLSVVHEQQPAYFGGRVAEWLFEAFMTTGETFMGQGDVFSARDRFASALRVAPTAAQKAEADKWYKTANRLTTPTPTVRPSPTPLPSGWVSPAWTRRATGTPDPHHFVLISTTYLPNTFTGEGCKWAGVAGRVFDMKGAPLATTDTLAIRVEGADDKTVLVGAHQFLGPSGWLVTYDVNAKEIKGFVQVYYKGQPVSGLIPYTTRDTCYENMLILDIQQVKKLP